MSGLFSTALRAQSDLQILAIVGAGGTEEYEEVFGESAAQWMMAAEKAQVDLTAIGLEVEGEDDAEQVKQAIAAVDSPALWVVLIGHGTFDGREVKFNVRGPDFTDKDLAGWLSDYDGDLAVINMASASGSFIPVLAGPGRVVITATKNEAEVYYTKFGEYFSEAIPGLPEADLDNDDQVSLLECFIHASRKVDEYYAKDGRLATEHALIDDNGDGIGSRADWFEGTTTTRAPTEDAEPDGERASQLVLVKSPFERQLNPVQRERRDTLERQVKELRRKRDEIEEEDYYSNLEKLLLDLARIYDEVDDS